MQYLTIRPHLPVRRRLEKDRPGAAICPSALSSSRRGMNFNFEGQLQSAENQGQILRVCPKPCLFLGGAKRKPRGKPLLLGFPRTPFCMDLWHFGPTRFWLRSCFKINVTPSPPGIHKEELRLTLLRKTHLVPHRNGCFVDDQWRGEAPPKT